MTVSIINVRDDELAEIQQVYESSWLFSLLFWKGEIGGN